MVRPFILPHTMCIGRRVNGNADITATEQKEEIMDILNPVKNKEIGVCRRCGRKLKTIESIELGMGSTCYKKFMAQSIQKPLFKMRKNEVQNPEEPAFNIRGQAVIKVESADIKLHGTEEDKINENNS